MTHQNTANAALDKGAKLEVLMISGDLIRGVLDGLANAPIPSLILETNNTIGSAHEVHIIPLHAIARISFKPSKILNATSSEILASNFSKL